MFDVGANTGQSTRAVLRHNPNAVIHAFEPVKSTFDQFKENMAYAKAVKIYQLALSDVSDQTVHIVADVHSVNNAISKAAETGEAVQTITGDDFCDRNGISIIDYLKIDTEGHDLAALSGFRKMLDGGRVRFFEVEAGMHRGNRKHVYFEEFLAFTKTLKRNYSLFGLYDQVREGGIGALRRSNPVFILS